MELSYKDKIATLVENAPYDIDPAMQITGRPPTMASSEFLTNKQQGDWAEQIVLNAINTHSFEYVAIPYGRSEEISAGDLGFGAHYLSYLEELNSIGKRPDILIFKKSDLLNGKPDLEDRNFVGKAVAGIEVRSSSFLADKYTSYMENRSRTALAECNTIRDELLCDDLAPLLQNKAPELYRILQLANDDTFKEIDFRVRCWSTTNDLKRLTDLQKKLKEQIKILHKRDFLSITPKIEDIALVNRWIQHFNVRHYYLQVFFDKAYVIPFQDILEISSDSCKEGNVFFVEQDIKNQGKTTIKINIQVGKEIIGKIDMPAHSSVMKELDRGRLLFYVKFHGGKGYMDLDVFNREIIQDV
jgi:type II restriction enzyme